MDENQIKQVSLKHCENEIIYVTDKTKLIDILYQLQDIYHYDITWSTPEKQLILQFHSSE